MTYHDTSSAKQANTYSDINLLAFLANRWRWVALGTFAGLIAAAAYFYTAEEYFTSSAQILVLQKQSGLAGTEGSNDVDYDSTAVSEEILATHIAILSSPIIIQNALESSRLFELDSLQAQLPEDRQLSEEAQQAMIVGYVRRNLEGDKGSEGSANGAQILRISFTHTSSDDSATVLSAIIDSYQQFVGKTVRELSGQASDLIQKTSKELEQQVRERDAEYREFVKSSPLGVLNDHASNPHEARITLIEAEISRLQIAETDRRSRLVLMHRNRKATDPMAKLSAIDAEDVARLSLLFQVDDTNKTQSTAESALVFGTQADIVSDAFSVGPNHPRYLASQAKLNELMRTLDRKAGEAIMQRDVVPPATKLAKAYNGLLKNDLDDIRNRKKQAIAYLEKEQQLAKQLIDAQLEQKQRLRELENSQALYDSVVTRIGEIDLLGDYAGFVNEVIAPVNAGSKTWPKLPLLAAVGILGGLFTGLGFATVVELRDHTFQSPEDIERELSSPVLTHIPSLRALVSKTKSTNGVDPTIITSFHPDSWESEAFRRLRTSINYRTKKLAAPTCLVTSGNQGDGKSTVVSNLAVSMAHSNRRVLLVDADLRVSNIHRLFGLSNETGLANVLDGSARMEDAIQATQIPGLSIVSAGQTAGNPAELLPLPSFDKFLQSAKSMFDVILIDSPPVLAVSDAVVIAPKVDCAVLSLKVSDRREYVHQAFTQLTGNGANVVGMVVNCQPSSQGVRYQKVYRRSHGVAQGSRRNREYFALQNK